MQSIKVKRIIRIIIVAGLRDCEFWKGQDHLFAADLRTSSDC